MSVKTQVKDQMSIYSKLVGVKLNNSLRTFWKRSHITQGCFHVCYFLFQTKLTKTYKSETTLNNLSFCFLSFASLITVVTYISISYLMSFVAIERTSNGVLRTTMKELCRYEVNDTAVHHFIEIHAPSQN